VPVAFKINLRKNSGIALIFVLGTVAIISVIAIEMAQKVQMAKMMVVERRDSVKALELAKAAYRWSLFRLQMDKTLDKVPAIPGTNYGGPKDDFSEIQWNFPLTYPFPVTSILTGTTDDQPQSTPSDPGENGTFASTITDESAKLNINDVGSSTIQSGTRWSGAASILVNLLASPRFQLFFSASSNKNILDIPRAIDDWTDSDTQVNYLRGGDENTEYKTENITFNVKNGKMYTVDEVRMLEPMNYKLFEELKPFITVYPFDAKLPRISASPVVPLGKLNINTAPVELIAAIFSQTAMTSNRARLDCAQLFAKMRAVAAFRSVKSGGTEPNLMTFLQSNCGGGTPENVKTFIDSEVLGILDVRSDVFRIEASGFAGDIEKKIEAVVLRSGDKPKVLYWKVY
jgi:type II secretory pathway component PulK